MRNTSYDRLLTTNSWLTKVALSCALSVLLGGSGTASAAPPPKCPNLVILLDQSASMKENPQGQLASPTKWEIATKALTILNNKYDGFLPIGYSNFPSADNACTTADFYPGTRVGYGHRIAINNAMITYPWNGGSTPTCDAISKLAATPELKDATRPQYVLLVTDGAPALECCGMTGDPVQKTVDAIRAAASQNPPIKTFVVGFGNLPANQQVALNQMAIAGGVPDTTPNYSYYRADSDKALDQALTRILSTIVGGGDAGVPIACEDGCYGTPCPTGQACLQNTCKPNPCATLSCGPGESCLPNGTTASCVAVCERACPDGSRCDRGRCISDPCGGPCPSGKRCNTVNAACETDTKCQGVVCHTTQGCFDGKCVDNPCAQITCPSGTECIDFLGMCTAPRTPGENLAEGGCSCKMGSGGATTLGPLSALFFLSLGLLVRRRRARA